jgi:serine/threonine protein kinase
MTEQLIGNYRIIEKLGEGGMGEVFKALDVMLEREVAIKMLRPDLSSRPDVVERFRTEAVALARLNHPHIATLYSFSRQENQFCMVLEFVRGETLDAVIARRGALPWREAIRLICQALDGLEHAHRLGIVHRDIKPSNMMLTCSGSLKLMDFGIARILERARLTQAGHLIGTLEYMSPEQIQGKETDARSDIYSIGIVLYELLTKRLPFEKSTDYDLIKSQVEEPPPALRSFMPEILGPIEDAVLRALAKAPERRFHSAAEFRAELEKILSRQESDQAVRTPRPSSPETRIAGPGIAHGMPEFASRLASSASAAPERGRPVRERTPAARAHAATLERWKSRVIAICRVAWKDYPVAVVFTFLLLVSGGLFALRAWFFQEPVSANQIRRAAYDALPATAMPASGSKPLPAPETPMPAESPAEEQERPVAELRIPPSPENPFQPPPSPLEVPAPTQTPPLGIIQPADAADVAPVKPSASAPGKRPKFARKKPKSARQSGEDQEYWKDKSREVEEFLKQ